MIAQNSPPPDIVGMGPCWIAGLGTVFVCGCMAVEAFRKRKRIWHGIGWSIATLALSAAFVVAWQWWISNDAQLRQQQQQEERK